MRHDKGYVFNTSATFHERLRVLFIPDIHIKGSREKGCIDIDCFFFLLRTVSYFSLQSYCTRNKPKQRKRRAVINEGVTS